MVNCLCCSLLVARVGKTSIITTFISDNFPENVDPVLCEVVIPADCTTNGASLTIVDSSCILNRISVMYSFGRRSWHYLWADQTCISSNILFIHRPMWLSSSILLIMSDQSNLYSLSGSLLLPKCWRGKWTYDSLYSVMDRSPSLLLEISWIWKRILTRFIKVLIYTSVLARFLKNTQ